MLTIGDRFPEYHLKGVTSNEISGIKTFSSEEDSKQWKVFFFWPKDFTFVCPTEIEEFGRLYNDFAAEGAELYGVSTDSEFVHMAWRNAHPGLSELPLPMLSDITRELSWELGILHQDEGVCLRATYIVDPENIIRHVTVNDLDVGRNPQETLRILRAYKKGGLMPCNWQPGQDPLRIA